MNKISSLIITVLSVLTLVSCQKKEEIGYEKAYKNRYKSDRYLFDFYSPYICKRFNLDSNGDVDSIKLSLFQYSVYDDSILLHPFYRGVIKKDKLILKQRDDNVVFEALKIK